MTEKNDISYEEMKKKMNFFKQKCSKAEAEVDRLTKLLNIENPSVSVARGFSCRVDPTCTHTCKTPGGRLKHEKKHGNTAPRIRVQSQKEF